MIYTHLYPTPERFGIPQDTRVVHYFARDWQKMGHRVQVVVLNHWPVKEIFRHDLRQILPREDDYEYEGVPVHIFNYQLLTPRRRCPEAFQARRINAMLRGFKQGLGWTPDKVFVNFPTFSVGLTEIFAEEVPSIAVFHLSDVINLKLDDGPRVRSHLERFRTWGYRNPGIGHFLKERFDRASVPVYSGIDEDLIADAGVIKNKKHPHPLPLRLLYAGKLIERKRADDLIRAVRQLDFPWVLMIVGDGPEMGAFRAAAGGDPRILFKGQLSREETVACMQEADAFLMVSIGETFGLVYLEAMGQGCITVASRGEGIDGVIIDGENGYLVPAGDIGAIKDVICRIRDLTGEEKGQIIQKGYDLARTMTSMQTSKRYFEANS